MSDISCKGWHHDSKTACNLWHFEVQSKFEHAMVENHVQSKYEHAMVENHNYMVHTDWSSSNRMFCSYSPSFQAQQPLEKCLWYIPFILASLYCHVLMTRHGGNFMILT
jgi:hypothetical protein